MPELPEVETITRQLSQALMHDRWMTGDVEVYSPKVIKAGDAKDVGGKTIKDVQRVGKYIVIRFEAGRPCLVMHLGMTGQLALEIEVDTGSDTPRFRQNYTYNPKYLRLSIPIWDGIQHKWLALYDMRKFGRVYIYNDGSPVVTSNIAPDVLQMTETTWERTRVAKSKALWKIKDYLMDQGIVSGLGNIYANEALSMAGISPLRTVGDIPDSEWKVLLKSMKVVIAQGVHNGGTTFSDYGDLYGRPGANQGNLAVFQREGQACRLCASPIVKVRQKGRSSYYCPRCQR